MEPRFPTLDLIDRALADPARALGRAANAAELERRARELADAYWSERVWLTGSISGPAFDRVVADLQTRRIAPLEVATETPGQPATGALDPEERVA